MENGEREQTNAENKQEKCKETGKKDSEYKGIDKQNEAKQNTDEQPEEGNKRNIKIGFWNIAGVNNKDEEFWEYLHNFDVIGMTETWVEEKKWMSLEEILPKGYKWKAQHATREKKKGRAKGGIITGVRNEIEETELNQNIQGLQEREIIIEKEKWRIITVYNNFGMEIMKEKINEYIEETKEYNLVLGGDFNARIGEKGGFVNGDTKERKRFTRDKEENKDGKKFLDLTEARGWHILNGNMQGDERGEYTYIGHRGNTVIDYIVTNTEATDKIEKFEVGERTESEHQPVLITLKKETEKAKQDTNWIYVNDWSEEGIEKYKCEIEKQEFNEKNPKRMVEELIKITENAISKKKKKEQSKREQNRWWDKECRVKKREMRKFLRQWKNGHKTETEYKRKCKEYKEICKAKKKKREEDYRKEIECIKSETDVWKHINQDKKTARILSKKIQIEEWREHFMQTLQGKELHTGSKEKEVRYVDKDVITETEIDDQIAKLKKKKAAGEDKITNEAWIYGTPKMKERVKEIFNNVWKGEGFPMRWRQGIICPIYKKGEHHKIENYRGITLLDTLYKLYAMVIEARLRKDVENKKIIPDNQAGFRKGRGTVDNIYILKHVIDKEIAKEKGKVYTFFTDLKSAFDLVDRELLWKIMERQNIDKNIIFSIQEIYAETSNVVRAGDKYSKAFWTERGLRQGCPLSPILFSLYLADLEKSFGNWQTGGVLIGKRKIWTLSYADDIVLIAKKPEEMKDMIRRMERYLDGKKMILSTEKSKILIFKKGGGKQKKEHWKWKGQEIEEVKVFKYLGYTFQKSNEDQAHINELAKKARIIMAQVWGLGERKFKDSYKTRLFMFDSLVRSVLLYGVEIWGWREYDAVEKIQETYIKWILGLDRQTPSYIVLEETKRDKIRIQTGIRAMRYEDRISISENMLLEECWKEKEGEKEKTSWNTKRKQYFERNGHGTEDIKRRRRTENVIKSVAERDREVQRQVQHNSIENSTYNKIYKEIRTIGEPRYLKGTNRAHKIIARFRCGNEEMANYFWKKEEERKCRMCKKAEETMEHMKVCEEMETEGREVEVLLDDTGEGRQWMRKILRRRKQIE